MPITDQVLQYKNPIGSSQATGVISIQEIMKMPQPDFLVFKQRLMNVRFRTRYDTAVYEIGAGVIAANTTVDLFRKGVGDKDTYGNSANEYKKTLGHTNMPKKGEFPQGSLIIIADIVAKKAFTSGLPTGVTAGIVTNPKAAAAVATNDPTLNLLTWLENVHLDYTEDGLAKVTNYLGKFTQNEGISGFMGASVGGVAQNFGALGSPLPQPRAMEGGDDFGIVLRHVADFDNTAATGINQVVTQRVELETVELIVDRP